MKAVLFFAGKRRGMTLTEVLITIAVIGILASVVLVAVNPKQNLEDADDVKRQQDLRVMIDAIYQYQIDHREFPNVQATYAIDAIHRDVCVITGVDAFLCTFVMPWMLPLGPLVPDYLAALPRDPQQPGVAENCGEDFSTIMEDCSTGYQLWLDENGRLHAFAPLGDDGNGIEVAR